ncbi:MAG TPA: DUF3365 domain-containing protein [Gemmataceae bacterium]|jgi:hypothetical protein|nr:DUF3365 domain-containing protein [Gemmataceae bacterium]
MNNWSNRIVVAVAVGACAVVGLTQPPTRSLAAKEPTKPDPAAVERAREEVKKLDDLYKTAVVGITKTYVEQQADTPAATVAKALFEAMHQKGYHHARLIDATGKPKNKKNVAETEFEKKAVAAVAGGKTYIEEVGEKDGKPVFRAGTVVPAVMSQCAVCHGGKEGRVLGAIVYELPIK